MCSIFVICFRYEKTLGQAWPADLVTRAAKGKQVAGRAQRG